MLVYICVSEVGLFVVLSGRICLSEAAWREISCQDGDQVGDCPLELTRAMCTACKHIRAVAYR